MYRSLGCGLEVGAARVSDLQRCVRVGQRARAIAHWVLVYWVHATGASRGVCWLLLAPNDDVHTRRSDGGIDAMPSPVEHVRGVREMDV